MLVGGAIPAGSSRGLRLDPFALPVRFQAEDPRADERTRSVELHRERVVVRRAVRGMRMALNLPVAAYRGVAVQIIPPDAAQPGAIAVMLEHSDPGLSLPLLIAADGEDVVAAWRSWANVLGLPLLVADADGSLREPLARLGAVRIAPAYARRRRRGPLKRRRPSIFMRRKAGSARGTRAVHRDEREIIARN